MNRVWVDLCMTNMSYCSDLKLMLLIFMVLSTVEIINMQKGGTFICNFSLFRSMTGLHLVIEPWGLQGYSSDSFLSIGFFTLT